MMKKSFFLIAAALTLGFAACTDEPVNPVIPGEGGNEVSAPMVKSAADLIGTEWEYTLDLGAGLDLGDLYDCMDSADIAGMLTMTFGLNFDASYAHLTFPEDVIGLNVVEDGDDYTVEEISEMAYTYTYDASTTSGTLTGGNLADLVIPFTYDTANDQITISMLVADEGDEANAVPFILVFSRVN